MADLRITELPALGDNGGQPNNDVVALADVSASETKKVTPNGIVLNALSQAAGAGGIPNGTIDPDLSLIHI